MSVIETNNKESVPTSLVYDRLQCLKFSVNTTAVNKKIIPYVETCYQWTDVLERDAIKPGQIDQVTDWRLPRKVCHLASDTVRNNADRQRDAGLIQFRFPCFAVLSAQVAEGSSNCDDAFCSAIAVVGSRGRTPS